MLKRVTKKVVKKKPVNITGKLQITSHGYGFVLPEQEGQEDIFISRFDLADAMNGDKVQVELHSGTGRSGGHSQEGHVVRVLERKFSKVVGTFVQSGDFAFIEPDDKHLDDIFIAGKNFNGAKHMDKVYVEITVYPDAVQHRKAEGRVLEVLGKTGDVGLEILSIIKQKGLPLEFPKEVLQAASKLPERIKTTELTNRLDRRERMIITIDGDDAKDFDDAIWVEKVPGKEEWDLGVYIADVSYYVKEDGPIDLEARERGNSVYLVDRVLPMLPERLCNGICSLNEDVDRLVLACEMRINAEGKVTQYNIAPAVIHSHHRLTYDIVREILKGDKKLCKKYADCVPMLRAADELRKVLWTMRVKRGAINFELTEVRVVLDENLHPIDIKPRVQGDSENLIEEFMLAANECVARHLVQRHFPAVFRIHEPPKAAKLEDLGRLFKMFGIPFFPEEEVQSRDIQQALNLAKGRPEEKLLSSVALRSMRQAVYAVENLGHFGLAAENYVHFTSPIRRYPDLLIHRLLWLSFQRKTLKKSEFQQVQEYLQPLAVHSSQRERLAIEAERDTQKLKMCEYMAERIGEEYDGIISGVTNFGIFVELPNGVEGMVRLENLKDDYYEFQEERYAVVGINKRKQFRLGDELHVAVANVNIEEMTIDLEIGGEKNGRKDKNHSGKPQSSSRLQPAGKVGGRNRAARHGGEGSPSGQGKSKGRLRSGHKKS